MTAPQSSARQTAGTSTITAKVNRIERCAVRGRSGPPGLDAPMWSLLDRSVHGVPALAAEPAATASALSCAIEHQLSWSFVKVVGLRRRIVMQASDVVYEAQVARSDGALTVKTGRRGMALPSMAGRLGAAC